MHPALPGINAVLSKTSDSRKAWIYNIPIVFAWFSGCRIFQTAKTECPFQRTFWVWCRTGPISRFEDRWMLSLSSPITNLTESRKKRKISHITDEREDKKGLLKNDTPLNPWSIHLSPTEEWYFYLFLIVQVFSIIGTDQCSMRTFVTCFVELIQVFLRRDIRM